MLTFILIHSKEEDYRWAVLRKKIPPWLFQITNLVFIGTSYICIYAALSDVTSPRTYSCNPKHPPAPDSHSGIDRRNTPKPARPLRHHPSSDRARPSRVRNHSGQPAIRVPRVETREVRRARAMARCASRVDQGRRRARFLHPRSVVLESPSELLRRAVVLGGLGVLPSLLATSFHY